MDQAYRLPEEIKVGRYTVRRIRPSDANAIHSGWATDPDVVRYLTWKPHTTIAQTQDFASRGDQEWQKGTSFPAVISPIGLPEDLIGMVHPRVVGWKVSYGWLIRRDFWDRGVATEVVRWAIEHALSHPAIFRTEASCDVANIGSARVMEKAGMTREGMLRRYNVHPTLSPEPRDSFLYAKVR